MQKGSVKKMSKALVIIDIQNDITKNYRDIIDKINKSVVFQIIKIYRFHRKKPGWQSDLRKVWFS